MQFDKQTLQAVLALDDAALWQLICRIAAQNGITLPKTPPPAETLSALRATVSGKGQKDIAEALRIIDDYRKSN